MIGERGERGSWREREKERERKRERERERVYNLTRQDLCLQRKGHADIIFFCCMYYHLHTCGWLLLFKYREIVI